VDGATTVVANTKEGVTVTVTAKSEDAVKEIRARAKHEVDVAKLPPEKQDQTVDHNGAGGGGGSLGRCPVIVQGDTTVESKDSEGGAVLTVKAKKSADVPALQKEAKERAEFFATRKK
jgi:hypothetical protein